jgi:hypothetical protein
MGEYTCQNPFQHPLLVRHDFIKSNKVPVTRSISFINSIPAANRDHRWMTPFAAFRDRQRDISGRFAVQVSNPPQNSRRPGGSVPGSHQAGHME